jgi:hypothetical protein
MKSITEFINEAQAGEFLFDDEIEAKLSNIIGEHNIDWIDKFFTQIDEIFSKPAPQNIREIKRKQKTVQHFLIQLFDAKAEDGAVSKIDNFTDLKSKFLVPQFSEKSYEKLEDAEYVIVIGTNMCLSVDALHRKDDNETFDVDGIGFAHKYYGGNKNKTTTRHTKDVYFKLDRNSNQNTTQIAQYAVTKSTYDEVLDAIKKFS